MWLPLQLISTVFWAGVNILDSSIVAHYEKRPFVLQWYQSFFTLSLLGLLALLYGGLQSSWMLVLLLSGMSAYVGDALFFHMLDRIDISVVNIAWAIMTIFLAVAGYMLFGETWSLLQMAGVVLVLSGIFLLSSSHRKIAEPRSLLLFPLLAALHTPFYIAQKAAIMGGESVMVALFWPLLARELLAGGVPFLVPGRLKILLQVPSRRLLSFHVLNGAVVGLFFLGVYFTALSLQTGPVALVSVVGNTQPFVVLFLAWILWKIVPSFASRELLTLQAVRVKIVSFLVVFTGLALLALPQ